MSSTAKPGAIGVTPIRGWGGAAIKAGERAVDGRGDGQHAFVLLDDGTVIEAEATGARISPLAHCARPVVWLDPPISDAGRAVIVRIGRGKEHTRYSWWAYAGFLFRKAGWVPAWLQRKLDGPEAMCSQLAVRVWREAAAELDGADRMVLESVYPGRDPATITPGDLEWWARHQPWPVGAIPAQQQDGSQRGADA